MLEQAQTAISPSRRNSVSQSLRPPESRRIHCLRGLAIILVVAGHYMPDSAPEAWRTAKALIYLFHMPVFFFLSGYLFCGELARGRDAGVGAIVKKKAARLLIPWVCAAVGYLLIKLILPFFIRIGDPLTRDTLINLIRDPLNSYVPIIWFLQALFIVTALFMFLRVRLGMSPPLIFIIFFFLSFIPFPLWLSLDGAVHHMQFFTLGYFVSLHSLNKRIGKLFLLVAVPIFAVNAAFAMANPGHVLTDTIGSYSGVVAMALLAMLLAESHSRTIRLIERVGRYTMGIYLLHLYPVGAVAVLCYRGGLNLPDNLFVFGLAAAVLVGVGVSAGIEKYLLRRYEFTRKLVLGMSR